MRQTEWNWWRGVAHFHFRAGSWRDRKRKEIVALAIHHFSLRCPNLVYVNCGALPDPLWRARYSATRKSRLAGPIQLIRVCSRWSNTGTLFWTKSVVGARMHHTLLWLDGVPYSRVASAEEHE